MNGLDVVQHGWTARVYLTETTRPVLNRFQGSDTRFESFNTRLKRNRTQRLESLASNILAKLAVNWQQLKGVGSIKIFEFHLINLGGYRLWLTNRIGPSNSKSDEKIGSDLTTTIHETACSCST